MTEAPIVAADRPSNILTAARLLREGGVVAIPTDTVYGLAASIYQPPAIQRILEIKRRPPNKGMPVLLATAADLPLVVREVPRISWLLIDRFWPGALTLVLPAKDGLSPDITGGEPTVAVRVPGARSTLELLQVLGEPVIGTSANVSGQPPTITAAEAAEQLPGIDAVFADDAAISWGALPSTIVEVTDDAPLIRRLGAVPESAIRAAIGPRAMVRSAP